MSTTAVNTMASLPSPFKFKLPQEASIFLVLLGIGLLFEGLGERRVDATLVVSATNLTGGTDVLYEATESVNDGSTSRRSSRVMTATDSAALRLRTNARLCSLSKSMSTLKLICQKPASPTILMTPPTTALSLRPSPK